MAQSTANLLISLPPINDVARDWSFDESVPCARCTAVPIYDGKTHRLTIQVRPPMDIC